MNVYTGILVIDEPVIAIVQFGPPSSTSGMRAGEYYQVVIDPNMTSPDGNYIRFDSIMGSELNGWQRIDALTVCELLGYPPDSMRFPDGYTAVEGATVTMRAIEEDQ